MTKPNKMESKKDILLHAIEITTAAARGGHPVKPEIILEGVYRKLLDLCEEAIETDK